MTVTLRRSLKEPKSRKMFGNSLSSSGKMSMRTQSAAMHGDGRMMHKELRKRQLTAAHRHNTDIEPNEGSAPALGPDKVHCSLPLTPIRRAPPAFRQGLSSPHAAGSPPL